MSSKRDALRQLRELRAGGGKRSEQYQVRESGRIIEEVDEDEYRKLCKERRNDNFVVDDQGGDGGGYIDDGQELWDEEEYDSELERLNDEEEMGGSKNARKMLDRARKQRQAERDAAARRMQEREKGQRGIAQFFKGASRSKPATRTKVEEEPAPVDTAAVDDMLEGFEDELLAMDEGGSVGARPTRVARSTPAAVASASSRKRPVEECRDVEPSGAVKAEEDAVVEEHDDHAVELLRQDTEVNIPKSTTKRRRTSLEEASVPVEAAPRCELGNGKEKKEDEEGTKKEDSTSPQGPRPSGAPAAVVKDSESPQKVVDFGDSWLITDDTDDAESKAASSPHGSAGDDHGLDAVKEEDGSLMMYLLDVYEDVLPDKTPALYLFGKTRRRDGGKASARAQFDSCCVVVTNIMRNCFFLPREQSEDESECRAACYSVMQEFEALRKKSGGVLAAVNKYKCKFVWRNYCFDQVHGIPHGRLGCLKVVYSSNCPALPSGLEGKSFSHVFGNNTSLTELFLVKRRIMGPCWIQISAGSFNASTTLNKLSWCTREVRVQTGTKGISVVPADATPPLPPLSIMSLSIKTNTTKQTKAPTGKGRSTAAAQQQQHEIAVAAYYHNPNLDVDEANEECLRRGMQTFMAVTKIEGVTFPKGPLAKNIVVESSERALLNHLAAMVTRADPDIILGHNIFGFGLDILAQRMQHHKLPAWHKFSRLKRPTGHLPFGHGGKKRDGRGNAGGGSLWLGRSLTAGRLVCDTYLSAREYLRLTTYDLGSLSLKLLKTARAPVALDSLVKFYEDPRALSALAEHTLTDAVLQLRVGWALQVLSLTRQLTNLAGNLWSHSLQNKRAERNEILLVHEFHRKKFIVPDKERPGDRKSYQADVFDEGGDIPQAKAPAGPRRKKAAYAGGLVLEPKAGLYDKLVLLLDFNSLYPSIIREYNICFTTVDRLDAHDSALGENAGVIPELPKRAPGERDAVLPQVITRLVESRKDVKKLLKTCTNPKTGNQLDIRQKALKLTANSMYGCLGFSNSRFYAKPIAALITRTGRETLQATVDIVESHLRFDVVYGDTDSIFVHTGTEAFDQAMRIGGQIMAEVNKRYKKLELDIDGVFKRLLLLKKKKYAGVKVIDWAQGIAEKEYKGLDLVRRDWCPLSKKMGDEVLRCLLGLRAESQAPASASAENGPADVDRSAQEAERVVEWLHDYVKSISLKMDNDEVTRAILGGEHRGLSGQAGEHQIPLEDYVITKALTKMPADYPDAKSQAHVMVAKRMMDGGHVIRPGNEIPYVITRPGEAAGKAEAEGDAETKPAALGTDSQSVAARARSPDEVRRLGPSVVQIDTQWYKTHQIHPPLVRLCAPVSGTDAAHLAECLGLDPSKFAAIGMNNNGPGDGDDVEAVMASLSQNVDIDTRYSDARKFLAGAARQYKCPKCKTTCHIGDAIKQKECVKCSAEIPSPLLHNLLVLILRKITREAGSGWVRCDDEGCGKATRQLPLGTSRCPFGGCRGKLQQLPAHTNRAVHQASALGASLRRRVNVPQVLSYLRELAAKHRPELRPSCSLCSQGGADDALNNAEENNTSPWFPIAIVSCMSSTAEYIVRVFDPPPPPAFGVRLNPYHGFDRVVMTSVGNTAFTEMIWALPVEEAVTGPVLLADCSGLICSPIASSVPLCSSSGRMLPLSPPWRLFGSDSGLPCAAGVTPEKCDTEQGRNALARLWPPEPLN
ncbi:DNA-directed DNA polymerase alpha catalytic subunit pol1 [Perkinsus olseni]|uniref:DNA polymerase n=1 Tax=Perkinsus olseni TaxID=32597 RepID=A0A7J6MCM5_PEROL|nr:DNA-directed DNA polymerase alpha catalytic subunit pol1 [Perkinsus olseni]